MCNICVTAVAHAAAAVAVAAPLAVVGCQAFMNMKKREEEADGTKKEDIKDEV